MDEALTMRRRFVALAPWHANGTASAADRAWVERYVRSHPEAREELEWYASLRQNLRADAPEQSPDAGLERLLHRVRLERQPLPRQPERGLALLLGRIRDFLSGVVMRPAVTYAAIALVAVALLDQHAREREYAEYRSFATVAGDAPLLRVTFKPEATERDIRGALLDVAATLVGGPGQLGEYLVRVPPGKVEAAAAKLRAHATIEAVEVSPTP